ncbi:MAG: sulfite exporter TauE/SafE family protein [Acidimicrobiales bacterium]
MNTRALLASPLGFLIGVSLGALGGGGSILAVPVLVYAAGESPKQATTTSLLVVGTTAVGGMVAHLRAGRVRVVPGILFGLAGVGGSLLGTQMNHYVDENVLLLAFAGLMAVAAWRMWVNQAVPGAGDEDFELYPEDGPEVSPPGPGAVVAPALATRRSVVVVKVLVAGTIVGFITGFFGVGGGFVVVPALVLALGFDMAEAVGTSLLVIAINSAVALATRVGTSGVDWGVAVPFTIAGLLGVSVGKRLADRLPTTTLVRWFVGLLVVLAVYVAIRAGLALASG